MLTAHQAIATVFKPNTPMDDPDLFAGRKQQLEGLLRALHTEGACPVILGDRGLGKTSLAIQIQRIAQGDVTLLEDYGLHDAWGFEGSSYFMAFLIQCTDEVQDFQGVLQRMINAMLALEVVRDAEETVVQSKRSRMSVKLPVLEAGIEDQLDTQSLFQRYENLGLEEQVVRIGDHLSGVTGTRVLFIVDEIDRINPNGLAAFVKATSSATLRFMLVGIGQTLSELISDHASLERTVFPVPVERMQDIEAEAIVNRANDRLSDLIERPFEVGENALDAVVRLAGGFPWFIHVITQEAFFIALADASSKPRSRLYHTDGASLEIDPEPVDSPILVAHEHIDRAVRELPDNEFAHIFRDIYQRAVRDSESREIVLRSLAKWPEADIPTSETYALARYCGASNPSVYRGHLSQERYGNVLVNPPHQERGLVRFRNEMFKRYVNLRPSLFVGIRQRVDEAFRTNAYNEP